MVGTLGGGRWGTSAGPACAPGKDGDFVMPGRGSALVNIWFLAGAGFGASSCNPEKQNQLLAWPDQKRSIKMISFTIVFSKMCMPEGNSAQAGNVGFRSNWTLASLALECLHL